MMTLTPIKLEPKTALSLISNKPMMLPLKKQPGKTFSEMLNRADIDVIVSYEDMFYDP